jgi:hypothetical protein
LTYRDGDEEWSVGFWVLGVGFWVLGFGFWVLGFGFWNLEFGIWNLEFGIWNLEFGIWNLEFGIWNLESIVFEQKSKDWVEASVTRREPGPYALPALRDTSHIPVGRPWGLERGIHAAHGPGHLYPILAVLIFSFTFLIEIKSYSAFLKKI